MFSHCVIGAGVSGIILILLLIQTRREFPEGLVLIDPYLDGGDLARNWSPVISNTPWDTTLQAVRKFLPSFQLPSWATELPREKPTPVGKIAQLFRELLRTQTSKFQFIQASVKEANWDSDHWTILLEDGNNLVSRKLYCTYGSLPRELSYELPVIPLHLALDNRVLSDYVQPGQTVAVFGTAHSGTLVLKNLVDCGCKDVYGVFTGAVPFKWARDGEYDGLKLEAAAIADDIAHMKYPTIQLLRLSEFYSYLETHKGVLDWVVYATGFQRRTNVTLNVDGVPIDMSLYDGRTGRLREAPNVWGFGIAYPSLAPDGIHWDVGVSSFLEHIYRQIPQLLS